MLNHYVETNLKLICCMTCFKKINSKNQLDSKHNGSQVCYWHISYTLLGEKIVNFLPGLEFQKGPPIIFKYAKVPGSRKRVRKEHSSFHRHNGKAKAGEAGKNPGGNAIRAESSGALEENASHRGEAWAMALWQEGTQAHKELKEARELGF